MPFERVVQPEPEVDCHSRAWYLDEFGKDNRPYTAQEWPSPEPTPDALSDPIEVRQIGALLFPSLFSSQDLAQRIHAEPRRSRA